MAITPQAIKDQEFQVKFRGYDTVEVKAYLELIAEEFFELLEQVRQQVDELDVIVEERDGLQADNRKLQEEIAASRGSSEEIRTEVAERDNEMAALRDEIERLKSDIAVLEKENSGKDNELAEAQTKITQVEQNIQAEKGRNDKLASRLEDLEKQNEELRGEEIDFKSTLIAAQQFTNDLKKKSEQEAQAVIDRAKADAEQIRQETFSELASYPAEIERLKKLKDSARNDLEEVLRLCLENLDILAEDKDEEDYGELFQKIKLNDNQLEGADLDGISMNFDLPGIENNEADDVFSMNDETGSSDERG